MDKHHLPSVFTSWTLHNKSARLPSTECKCLTSKIVNIPSNITVKDIANKFFFYTYFHHMSKIYMYGE